VKHRLTTDERDRVAAGRDRQADERDRAAERRDRAADQLGSVKGRFSASARDEAALDRRRAASDRAEAARDREGAAHDRARADVDGLTGALRRERGLAELEREIDRARRSDGRLVLAFVDVDGLKTANDVDGHAAGDQLLRDVALALRTGLRSYDLVMRYGGDEFVCALPGSDMEAARPRFDEVARNLRERNPTASVSIGLAELESADTVDGLTARADAALYAGRRPGPKSG
jgi:diguanylate cyclase (GGDEF)-like protein